METNEKLMTLLRLMDEPGAMTETQLQELLADDEVREAYELMVDCKRVYKRVEPPLIPGQSSPTRSLYHHGESLANTRKQRAATPLHHGRGRGWVFFSRRIAAIFLAAAFLGGLAWAIIPYFKYSRTNSPQPAQVTTPSLQGMAGGGSVRFSNVRLDSILNVVAAHYGKTVCFRDKEPRSMKLITTWNPDDSLAVFIEHLNMFDYLHMTLRGDTIFVTADLLPAPPQGGE